MTHANVKEDMSFELSMVLLILRRISKMMQNCEISTNISIETLVTKIRVKCRFFTL
jgi:hypothetical protein